MSPREYLEFVAGATERLTTERLTRTAEAKVLGGGTDAERYVLEHGRDYRAAPLPRDVDRGEPGECYKTAADLALSREDLTYCEGWAESIIPVRHAWCVDADGRVVDPTWSYDEHEHARYLGVPFEDDFLRRALIERGVYGLLDNPLVYAAEAEPA